MSKDDRDVLKVLKFELDFIEWGGYGRSVRTPWKPTSVFQDSPTCINFGDPRRSHPCDECFLIDFVPAEHRSEDIPCHYIPLNEAGDTIASLQGRADPEAVEEAVKGWLRKTIAELERGRLAS
jgi:hypothetical protein